MPVSAAIVRALLAMSLAICVPFAGNAEERKGVNPFRASSKAQVSVEQGPVAKACGVRGKSLGKHVESGPGRWKLYDTAPGSMAPRPFYLTGFSDRCPRRLMGAVALFGSIELYELVHYGSVGIPPQRNGTDLAYARLRARACGSSRPCKSSGVRKLKRSVVFVDVYPKAGSPGRLELLMSGGKLAAFSAK